MKATDSQPVGNKYKASSIKSIITEKKSKIFKKGKARV